MDDKSKLRIDFVNLTEYWDESNSYPMGILYISAFLKKNGFTNIGYNEHTCMLRKIGTRIRGFFELTPERGNKEREQNLELLFEQLRENNPDVILLGPVTTFHLVEITDLTPRLREVFPNHLILAGGPHFGKEEKLDIELLRRLPELDAVVIGDAEQTVLEVVDIYSKYLEEPDIRSNIGFRDKLAQIPGIRVKDHEFKSRDPPFPEEIPRPDWELLETHLDPWKYTTSPKYRLSNRRNPITWVSRAVVDAFDGGGSGSIEDDVRYFDFIYSSKDYRFPFGVIIGSRGCPYNCSFCGSRGTRRVHSTERIFDEIKFLNDRYGIRLFVFFDPLFMTASRIEQERIRNLCTKIIESGIDIGYMLDIRVDVILRLPDELLGLMLRSGCAEMNFGLEKGSDEMLLKMTKEITILDQRKAVEKLRRISEREAKKLIINGTFILGGPEETKEDIRDTLLQCFSLHLDQATLYPLEICPGTEISVEALKRGIIEPGLSVYLDKDEYPLYTSEELPRRYLTKIKALSESVLDNLEELKKIIQELERQFVDKNMRNEYSYFEIKETKQVNDAIKECTDTILDIVRNNPGTDLIIDGQYFPAINSHVTKVLEEIAIIEDKLLKKYPDYDPYYWDYHPGFLRNRWNNFIKKFVELFMKENFQ